MQTYTKIHQETSLKELEEVLTKNISKLEKQIEEQEKIEKTLKCKRYKELHPIRSLSYLFLPIQMKWMKMSIEDNITRNKFCEIYKIDSVQFTLWLKFERDDTIRKDFECAVKKYQKIRNSNKTS